ncbi:MAG TPA: AI-2E family transporter [Thermoanaerobaculaceae bacterium]|nr:AI-2E family transporter [Thermoanaerobaculaceae bacterium]
MEPTTTKRTYTIIFLALAALVIGYLCYKILTPFLAAIAWAVIIAVAFQVPWAWLERRMPKHRSLAAALLTLAIALIVLLPGGLFAGVLASQAIDVANKVSAKLGSMNIRSYADFIALPQVANVLDRVQTRVGMSPDDFQKLASGFVTKASKVIAGASGKLVLGAFDAILTFVMVIFLLFFFFKDGKEMARALFELLPTDQAGRQRMSGSLQSMLAAIFRGSLLCAVAQGLTGGIGWAIAGLPSPALAGTAMAILSLLPVGGTAIVWLPGAIYLWAADRHGSAIFLLAWGVVVASFLADNVLRPFLIRGGEELSTLVVFLGVFGGLAAFGLLGIFIGPVALVLATTLIQVMRQAAKTGEPSPAGEGR